MRRGYPVIGSVSLLILIACADTPTDPVGRPPEEGQLNDVQSASGVAISSVSPSEVCDNGSGEVCASVTNPPADTIIVVPKAELDDGIVIEATGEFFIDIETGGEFDYKWIRDVQWRRGSSGSWTTLYHQNPQLPDDQRIVETQQKGVSFEVSHIGGRLEIQSTSRIERRTCQEILDETICTPWKERSTARYTRVVNIQRDPPTLGAVVGVYGPGEVSECGTYTYTADVSRSGNFEYQWYQRYPNGNLGRLGTGQSQDLFVNPASPEFDMLVVVTEDTEGGGMGQGWRMVRWTGAPGC